MDGWSETVCRRWSPTNCWALLHKSKRRSVLLERMMYAVRYDPIDVLSRSAGVDLNGRRDHRRNRLRLPTKVTVSYTDLPRVAAQHAMGWLSPQALGRCLSVCRAWSVYASADRLWDIALRRALRRNLPIFERLGLPTAQRQNDVMTLDDAVIRTDPRSAYCTYRTMGCDLVQFSTAGNDPGPSLEGSFRINADGLWVPNKPLGFNWRRSNSQLTIGEYRFQDLTLLGTPSVPATWLRQIALGVPIDAVHTDFRTVLQPTTSDHHVAFVAYNRFWHAGSHWPFSSRDRDYGKVDIGLVRKVDLRAACVTFLAQQRQREQALHDDLAQFLQQRRTARQLYEWLSERDSHFSYANLLDQCRHYSQRCLQAALAESKHQALLTPQSRLSSVRRNQQHHQQQQRGLMASPQNRQRPVAHGGKRAPKQRYLGHHKFQTYPRGNQHQRHPHRVSRRSSR